jgi:uncharacterized protein (DUF433 family)
VLPGGFGVNCCGREVGRDGVVSVFSGQRGMNKIIVSNPAILSGEPVFRGTRVPFKSLTDYLEHERSLSEFLEDFPSVSRADAIAALEEARISLTAGLK